MVRRPQAAAWFIVSVLAMQPAAARQNPASVYAADKPAMTFFEVLKIAETARQRGNELTGLDAVRSLEAEYSDEESAEYHAVAGVLLTLNPAVGNYREALRYADSHHGGKPSPGQSSDKGSLDGYKPFNALSALTHTSDAVQIIMINEAHHVPQHRAFTIELLHALQPQGFAYFAAETVAETDVRLNERGYPLRETGYYTTEPVYGDLIRTALKLGYRIVPYEPQPAGNSEQRERGQAANLVERILKRHPRAKILVHAGYNHINESGTLAGTLTMAQQFKDMTGLDPLTVDQTMMTERSAPEYEHPVYSYAVSQGWVSEPGIFRNARGKFWTLDEGKRDITLFHPRSRYVNSRPTWLRLGGRRSAYMLPRNVCGKTKRCLVKAKWANENSDAVPVDQLEVTGEQATALMLPAGEFLIEVEDAEGKQLQVIRVKRATDFLAARIGTRVALQLRRGEDSIRTELAYSAKAPAAERRPAPLCELRPDIWYVDLERATMDSVRPKLPQLASARAVVFDLRGYPGDAGRGILPHLLPHSEQARWMHLPQITGPFGERAGYTSLGWDLEPKEPHIAGQVIFLTNGRAISQAESVLGYVADEKLGKIVGAVTAGTNGNLNWFTVPTGYRIGFTGMRVTRHDGAPFHLLGVLPTIKAEATVEGIRMGRDEVLQRALDSVE